MYQKYALSLSLSSLPYCFCLFWHQSAAAYIGPGAGIAIGVSLLTFFIAAVSTILALVGWPLRYVWRRIKGRKLYKRVRFKKVVILGFDGMDFGITSNMMEKGQLPNFSRIKNKGVLKPLATTLPPISPVAWSSFQTGVNPGKHNIFDFITPNRKSGAPKLRPVDMAPANRRIRIGRIAISIPIGRTDTRLNRKSLPFLKILRDYGIFSNIIRRPVTFLPENFMGALLSAMCALDIKGTQGTFSFFKTRFTPFEPSKSTNTPTYTDYPDLNILETIEANKMIPNMCRKCDCWDNAPTERFFPSLKSEYLTYCRRPSRTAAKKEILEYITFYNTDRLHSTLDYVRTIQYEHLQRAA